MPLPPRPISWPPLPEALAGSDDDPPGLPPDARDDEPESEEEVTERTVDMVTMCCRHSCCTAFEEQPELMKKRAPWLAKLHEQGSGKDKYVFSLLMTLRTSEARDSYCKSVYCHLVVAISDAGSWGSVSYRCWGSLLV